MTAVVDERPHYRSAEQLLADALEGTAPHLTNVVAGKLGPATTAELAKAVARATDLAVRRRADESTAARLRALYELIEAGVDGIPDCSTDEAAIEQVSRG